MIGLFGRLAGHGRWRILALALVFVRPVAAPAGEALEGVALVIGQSGYEHLSALPNPANDARAVDRLLTELGFDVVTVTDADRRKLTRALDRFAEDAEEADVALVYYSGHGIEAGGENFLVPVDASVDSLDDAAGSLVPVSSFLDALQKAAPVSIVLLDACRDSPFPAGSAIRLSDGEPAQPVSSGGLGVPTRGASALIRQESAPAEGLGAVIGFAAAPGYVALDGQPGENSPYAAALLKHLSAAGFSFGDVMTMVGEEVYLKTASRQVPWTNSSLRRTLYFGGAPEEAGDPDEALIRGERRKLLLTMTSVGEAQRRQVAAAAERGGVPMDALFAMLEAVGVEAPDEQEALAALIEGQAERLKALIGEREALKSSDPEITRLAALAGDAVLEGALETAIGFHERAKARIEALSATVDQAEAELKARRLEFARVFAESGRTYALHFEHDRAAQDFGRAFEEAARWDAALALGYKLEEGKALADLGYYRADDAALEKAADTYRQALTLAPSERDPAGWVRAQAGLAMALWARGERSAGGEELAEAAKLLREALARQDRAADPAGWARLQGDLGLVLATLGQREAGPETLKQAAAALGEAVAAADRATDPLGWGRLQNRLGHALLLAGGREASNEPVEKAIVAFRAALEERRAERVPLDWAQTTNNLAIALATLGERETSPARLEESVALYRTAIDVVTRERAPVLWAETQSNLGTSLFALAKRESGAARFEEAAAAFRLALDEITRERSPLQWAALHDNLGLALYNAGQAAGRPEQIGEAIGMFALALEERTQARAPLDWASTQNNLGNAHYALGDADNLKLAIAAYDEALRERTRERVPFDWGRTHNNKGSVLHALGQIEQEPGRYAAAAAEFRAALEVISRELDALGWGLTQHNLGQTLTALGRANADKAVLAEARKAVEAARDVYAEAGQAQYADYFANMLIEIDLADLEITVNEKLKAAAQ